MAETRPYTRAGRRNIIDGVDLLSKSGSDVLICVPQISLEAARIFLAQRGLWRTSYAMAYGDSDYTIPTVEEFEPIEQAISQFLEDTTLMNCTDLATELAAISDGIAALGASSGCGCGAGGAGQTPPPIDPTDTGDITQSTGTPPDGYTTWEQYQAAKCDIATWIVQNLLDDVRWFQVVQISTLTVGGLAAGIVSVLSAGTLAAILAVLLSILAYEVTMLEDAEDTIVTYFDDLVCAILGGTDAQTSIDNFLSVLNARLDVVVLDPISNFLLKQLLAYWTDTTQFNLLYAPYDEVIARQIPGGADCAACGLTCNNFQVGAGTWLGGLTFDAVKIGTNNYQCSVVFNSDTVDGCSGHCGPMVLMSILEAPGFTGVPGGTPAVRIYQDGDCPPDSYNASGYSSDDLPPPQGVYCGRFFQLYSSTDFTVTVARVGVCF